MELQEIIALIFGILGVVGGVFGFISKAQLDKIRKELDEALEAALAVPELYKAAKSPDSERGEKLSQEEIAGLVGVLTVAFKEVVDLFKAIRDVFKKK